MRLLVTTEIKPVTLTDTALNAAKNMLSENPEYAGKSLRVYLDGKGCDGFFYGVTFDAPLPEDHHFPQDQIDIIVDKDAIQFLEGSVVDFVDDERGRGFLVNNPSHRKFRGKFYKKAAWIERLTEQPKS